MHVNPRLAATALAAAALGLSASPAFAQAAPAYPPTGGGTTVVTTPVSGVTTAPASLPRTGDDVLAATAIGLGAVAAGGALLLAGRRRRARV